MPLAKVIKTVGIYRTLATPFFTMRPVLLVDYVQKVPGNEIRTRLFVVEMGLVVVKITVPVPKTPTPGLN